MTGTLINAAAIILGGTIGLIINSRLPARVIKIIFQALGLFTILIGISMALKTEQFLFLVLSLVIGSAIGELLNIDKYLNKLSNRVKEKFKLKNEKFTEGLLTAFLLYCVGAMTIVGSIEEGMGNYPSILITKSIMDGFSSVALASALGVGVIFSIIPLIIYQGGLTWAAYFAGEYFPELIMTELIAVGGVLLIGLGISILEIKNIKVVNMLPSLIIIVVLGLIFL